MGTHIRSVRLKVLLDEFYTDHRQRAFVILQRSWTTVNDLQEHILKIFGIPRGVYLTVDGCLLPTEEAIHVVSESDAVKVHPTSTNSCFAQRLTDAFAGARIYSTTECTPGTGTSGLSSPGFTRSSAPKRLKQEISSSTPKEQSVTQHAAIALGAATSEAPTQVPVKAKRQRKRKRKSKPLLVEKLEPIVPVVQTAPPPKAKSNLHFRFNDQTTSHPEDTSQPPRIQKNPFTLPSAARVIRATCNNVQVRPIEAKKEPSIDANKDTERVAQPSKVQAPNAEQSSTLAVAPTEQRADGPPEAALETMRHHIDELNLPTVAIDALKQDDLIAFRMMKLTANYVPDLSAYIIGLVQSIEAANVIIFVMAGLEETREPCGKFSLDDDEDESAAAGNAESIDQQLLYIQRNEILHAKYVKVGI